MYNSIVLTVRLFRWSINQMNKVPRKANLQRQGAGTVYSSKSCKTVNNLCRTTSISKI